MEFNNRLTSSENSHQEDNTRLKNRKRFIGFNPDNKPVFPASLSLCKLHAHALQVSSMLGIQKYYGRSVVLYPL